MRFALLAALALAGASLCTAQDKKAGKRYALLIGVQKYGSDDLHDLECSDKDVLDLADTLRATGYRKGDVTVLSTREKGAPTVKAIRAAIKEFVERDYRKEDTVLIAFSGHGIQVGKRFYFCPQGARIPADPKEDDLRGLISVDELYRELKACKAGYRLVLTDCCRNNPYRAPRKVREVSDDLDLAEGMPRDVVMITSCSPGQKAYEDKDLGRGVFFHFVIEAMRGKADLNEDGVVTRAELEAYLRVQMAKHKSKQTPETITRSRLDPALSVIDNDGPLAGVLAPVARMTREGNGFVFPSISADGKTAVTHTYGDLQVFDLERRRRVANHALHTGANCAPLFLGKGRVLVGTGEGASLFDPADGKEADKVPLKAQAQYLGASRDEKRYWAAGGGKVFVLSSRHNLLETFDHGDDTVRAAALSRTGDRLLTGTDRGKVTVYDVDKGKQLSELEGHEKPIAGIHAGRDGKRALTICHGGKLIRWDLEDGKKIDECEITSGSDTPYSAVFQADGRRAVVGFHNGAVGIVDIPATGKAKLVATHKKHKEGYPLVAITPDGKRAVSACGNDVWLYEIPKE